MKTHNALSIIYKQTIKVPHEEKVSQNNKSKDIRYISDIVLLTFLRNISTKTYFYYSHIPPLERLSESEEIH